MTTATGSLLALVLVLVLVLAGALSHAGRTLQPSAPGIQCVIQLLPALQLANARILARPMNDHNGSATALLLSFDPWFSLTCSCRSPHVAIYDIYYHVSTDRRLPHNRGYVSQIRLIDSQPNTVHPPHLLHPNMNVIVKT